MVPRRALLRSLGAALTAGVAGCTDVLTGGDDGTDRTGTPIEDSTPGDDATPTTTPTATVSPTPEPTPSASPTPTPTFAETEGTPSFTPGGDVDEFGRAVALSGEVAVVGAPDYRGGSVFVFESGDDGWTRSARFGADRALDFGLSVARAEGMVVAGAPGSTPEGEAVVFERTGDGWTRTRLRPWEDDGGDSRHFGTWVACDGRTAAVSGVTRHFGPMEDYEGSVFVFQRANGEWNGVQKLATGEGDLFGTDVSLAGDRMLVGAPNAATGPGETHTGAVYVYERTDGPWHRAATLVPDGAVDRAFFGGSVATDGATAVVGAKRLDGPGVVYAFERTGGGWRQRARLSPGADPLSGAAVDDFPVACADGVAVVGVPEARESGRAYAFERTGGRWRRATALSTGETDPDENFGQSVAVAGGTALVGAPRPFTGQSGRGYLFDV